MTSPHLKTKTLTNRHPKKQNNTRQKGTQKAKKHFQSSPKTPTPQRRSANPIPAAKRQLAPRTKVLSAVSPSKVVDLVTLTPHLKTKPLPNRTLKTNNSQQKSAQKTKREAEASLFHPSPNQAALASTFTLSAIEVSFASAAFSSFSVASSSCAISFSPSRFANVRAVP